MVAVDARADAARGRHRPLECLLGALSPPRRALGAVGRAGGAGLRRPEAGQLLFHLALLELELGEAGVEPGQRFGRLGIDPFEPGQLLILGDLGRDRGFGEVVAAFGEREAGLLPER